MNAAKWVLTPLLVTVLLTWAGAFGQATDQGQAPDQDRAMSDQPLGPNPPAQVETERQVTVKRETEIQRPAGPGMVERGKPYDIQKEDAELRKWGELEPAGPPREGMAAVPPATQPSAGPQAARPPADVDIFLFEEPGATTGYWGMPSGPARGQIFGFRGEPRMREIYGYEGARAQRPARMGAIVEPVPQDASHDWSEGRNLVDDNLIQTRDGFDDPDDFYTKEWKVTAPPLVAHPHFHTIYDNELTQRYYSTWHGSPVNWAPNMMVEVPLPRESHEFFTSNKQLVTYFTPWKEGRTTSVAGTLMPFTPRTAENTGSASRSYAARGFGTAEIYGYENPEFQGEGMAAGEGGLFLGNQPLYFDDQDLIGGRVAGGGFGGGVLGYVSPEAESGTVTIERGARGEANMHLNEPWSTDVSIYGIPTAAGEATIVTQPGVYGYVGEEEHATKEEHKVKKEHKTEKEYKSDKECKDKSHHDKDMD